MESMIQQNTDDRESLERKGKEDETLIWSIKGSEIGVVLLYLRIPNGKN